MRSYFLLALGAYLSKGTIVCDDSYECGSIDLDDDDIVCDGYYSCVNSNITSSDGYVQCGGFMGCAISAINADSASVTCGGNYGCYNNHIYNPYDTTYCYGDNGCLDAVIRSNVVRLDGWCSGWESVIFGHTDDENEHSQVFVYGMYGASYSTMTSSSADAFSVYLHGYQSGIYVDIECESGSECYVYCAEDACFHTRLFCYEGSVCATGCDEEADYCVNEYTYSDYSDNELKAIKLLPDKRREKSRVEILEKQGRSVSPKKEDMLVFMNSEEKELFKKKTLDRISAHDKKLTPGSYMFWTLIGIVLAVATVVAVGSLWYCVAKRYNANKYQSLSNPVPLMAYT